MNVQTDDWLQRDKMSSYSLLAVVFLKTWEIIIKFYNYTQITHETAEYLKHDADIFQTSGLSIYGAPKALFLKSCSNILKEYNLIILCIFTNNV